MMMRLIRYLSVVLVVQFALGFIPCLAQEEDGLGKSIHLPRSKGNVYQLLQQVTQASGYLLMYDSNLIDNGKMQEIEEGIRTVAEAIHDITGNPCLRLSIRDNYILITPPAEPCTQEPMRILGTLLDAETGQPISSGTVYVQGSSWGTVSNQEGKFLIHIPDSMKASRLVFSHVGYRKQEIAISSFTEENPVISLEPNLVSLHEVVIRMRDPVVLIKRMLDSREKNYSDAPSLLATFYREGTHYRMKLLDLTEGFFEIYKPGVQYPNFKEQVRQLKNNRITFRSEEDSLIAKIRGGIGSCLALDVMQHLPPFLQLDGPIKECEYFYSNITWIEDRSTHVIYFQPAKGAQENYCEGEIYLDAETLALVQVSFRIHPRYLKKMALVQKQGKYIKITPQSAEYTLSYRQWGKHYYISHVRGDLIFKTKKKSWFSRSPLLHTWLEMATCHIDTTQVEPFPKKERMRTESIFMDTPQDYDPVFWRNFNVIPREKHLNESIDQLREQFSKFGQSDAQREGF